MRSQKYQTPVKLVESAIAKLDRTTKVLEPMLKRQKEQQKELNKALAAHFKPLLSELAGKHGCGLEQTVQGTSAKFEFSFSVEMGGKPEKVRVLTVGYDAARVLDSISKYDSVGMNSDILISCRDPISLEYTTPRIYTFFDFEKVLPEVGDQLPSSKHIAGMHFVISKLKERLGKAVGPSGYNFMGSPDWDIITSSKLGLTIQIPFDGSGIVVNFKGITVSSKEKAKSFDDLGAATGYFLEQIPMSEKAAK